MRSLAGKVAVVTGGAGGIGAAVGRRFAEEGMKVVLADLLADRLDDTVRSLLDEGYEAAGVVTDVTEYESVENLAKETVARYGAVHVVCNNAGTGGVSEGYMWEHDVADWRWGIDVNVLGVVHGIKAFVPLLLEQGEGHVVNTCSGNGGFAPIALGAMGGPATAVYPMTKAAVLCLTESLYTHLAMAGSRVKASVLFPTGFLDTGIWESWRHRPEKYATTQERKGPQQSLDAVLGRLNSAGVTIEFTPLEHVAAQLVEGLYQEKFWIIGDPSQGSDILARKAASLEECRDPDYLVDLVTKTADRTARTPTPLRSAGGTLRRTSSP